MVGPTSAINDSGTGFLHYDQRQRGGQRATVRQRHRHLQSHRHTAREGLLFPSAVSQRPMLNSTRLQLLQEKS